MNKPFTKERDGLEIYINTVKADKDDIKALKEAIKNGKDRIKRIVLFQSKIRIYTV